jgi:hypothetical protein
LQGFSANVAMTQFSEVLLGALKTANVVARTAWLVRECMNNHALLHRR